MALCETAVNPTLLIPPAAENYRRRVSDESDDALRDLVREAVRDAVRDAMPMPMQCLMSEEQHAWVDLAIEREARRAAFQRAVIEKTMLGLIWAAILGAGVIVSEYLTAHGVWKP